MLTSLRCRTIAVTAVAGAMAFGVSAIPASAATQQNGLVNVSLTNNTIQIPVGVAANVCNVAVNVIATGAFQPNNGLCTAVSSPTATGGGGGGGGSTSQQGLVNVSLANNTVQVPIGIAANVCNVTANVITSNTFQPNGGNCSATSTPAAGA